MYGTRDAPAVWQDDLEASLVDLGFTACVNTPCLYINTKTDIRIVAHVDDLLCEGDCHHLRAFVRGLEQKYELKHAILGPD